MAANTHIFYVSIAVYCGEPFDYQRYRHTALCFRPALPPTPSVSAPPSPPLSSTELTATPPLSGSGLTDPELQDGIERLGHADPDLMSGPAIIMHVVCGRNNGGHWELSVLASTVPAEMPNKSFAKEVPVGALLRPLSKAQLVSIVSQTPLDNEDPEFNCQVWVESALMRLSSDKFLNFDDYHNGLDSMVDATMEAADEVCM